jgi:hypothetical protein
MTDSMLRDLDIAVSALLVREKTLTPERIRERIDQLRVVYEVSDNEAELLARQLEERLDVTMSIGSVLKGGTYEQWLPGAKAGIDPYFWNRYEQLLLDKGLSPQVVATIDTVSDRILGLMENPAKQGPWDRRGMVVGHVQSGKTANYLGLITKAADSGYKLIIVIAGIHNNLRNQTQARIDEGFVGWDSTMKNAADPDRRAVGVGRINKSRIPITFTTAAKDFNKAGARSVGIPLQNLTEPAIFVIKKNPTTLKLLLEWLADDNRRAGRRKIDAPMLVIDDEADNASINVKHDANEVSRINGQIRELLQLSDRSCYVGYTATPFANIFIDPDTDDEMLGQDLFPRDFIVSLDPPSNYFGATRVFLDERDAYVRSITDNGDVLPLKHRKDLEVRQLPESLTTAIRAFIVSRAIRLARGHQSPHCSMLVNASTFTNIQRQLRNEIHATLSRMQNHIRLAASLPVSEALKNPEIAAMHQVWDAEYRENGVAWQDVQALLHESAAPISVVEVNSSSSGNLNYQLHDETGLNVIAVGGYSLSRGLTLEGLMISYFLRNSTMYDTLMQMGRWFGYRTGYDDLCRIWMPEEAADWYAHIAESIELLRDELRSMEAAGATPSEFGLKVRSHPDTLIVTARNKMGSSEKVTVEVGLSREFIETTTLHDEPPILEVNRDLARELGHRLGEIGKPPSSGERFGGGWLVKHMPVEIVLDFLRGYRNHPGSLFTDPELVGKYIETRRLDELGEWDILIAGITDKQAEPTTHLDESFGIPLLCQRRARGDGSDEKTIRIQKQRISSRGVERAGLTKAEIQRIEEDYDALVGRADTDSRPNYPDRIYRARRSRPLLVIHLLSIGKEDEDFTGQPPIVAWSISFPITRHPERTVTYVVNQVWFQETLGYDFDPEELGGDDA